MIDPVSGIAILAAAGCAAAGLGWRRASRQRNDAIGALEEQNAASSALEAQVATKQAELAEQHAAYRALEAQRGEVQALLADAQEFNRCYTEEARHLAEVRLPAAIAAATPRAVGATVPGLLHAGLAGGVVAVAHARVLDLVAAAVMQARSDMGDATRAAVRHTLEEPQVRLRRAQHQISAEIERHGGSPAVVESLMRIDAHASVTLHGLQRLRILAGSPPGVQRETSPLAEIIEAAKGRIESHQDIQYGYEPATGDVWVEGRLVEPVVLALTELLANATKHSTRRVDVTVHDAAAGYGITVDDRGITMSDDQRSRADRIMTADAGIDVTNLDDALQLGFPIIGRLAARYGLSAQFAGRSAFGGNRVVLLVPRASIVDRPKGNRTGGMTSQRLANPPMNRTAPNRGVAVAVQSASERTPSGLPIRQRDTAEPERVRRPGVRNADTDRLDADEMATGLSKLTAAMSDQNTDEGEPT